MKNTGVKAFAVLAVLLMVVSPVTVAAGSIVLFAFTSDADSEGTVLVYEDGGINVITLDFGAANGYSVTKGDIVSIEDKYNVTFVLEMTNGYTGEPAVIAKDSTTYAGNVVLDANTGKYNVTFALGAGTYSMAVTAVVDTTITEGDIKIVIEGSSAKYDGYAHGVSVKSVEKKDSNGNYLPIARSEYQIEYATSANGPYVSSCTGLGLIDVGKHIVYMKVSFTNADVVIVKTTTLLIQYPLTLTSKDMEVTASGDKLKLTSNNIQAVGLQSGHKITYVSTASIAESGEVLNTFAVESIEDADGNSVISLYDITYVYGKLKVFPVNGGRIFVELPQKSGTDTKWYADEMKVELVELYNTDVHANYSDLKIKIGYRCGSSDTTNINTTINNRYFEKEYGSRYTFVKDLSSIEVAKYSNSKLTLNTSFTVNGTSCYFIIEGERPEKDSNDVHVSTSFPSYCTIERRGCIHFIII